jgi:selenide,water dikinase
LAPSELEKALEPIRATFKSADYPNLLVGLDKADDAAVYLLNDDQAIITTTDFFPPVVDDPYDFGAIAAANALSDIYAMGGDVLFALNLVAFPDNLGSDVLREILRGGAEKVAEAGAVVVGGHSVNDKEPKYGMAVTGLIHPDKIKIKGAAKPGEKILLTKSLGVGVITTALKREQAIKEDVAAAVASMKQLNKKAASAAQVAAASAVTDVTGFGLLGHAREMAYQAGVNIRIQLQNLSWLPGAIAYGKQDQFPGGTGNNMFFFGEYMRFGPGVDGLMQKMLFTPETSGGLLVSLREENVPDFIAASPGAFLIGDVIEGTGLVIVE